MNNNEDNNFVEDEEDEFDFEEFMNELHQNVIDNEPERDTDSTPNSDSEEMGSEQSSGGRTSEEEETTTHIVNKTKGTQPGTSTRIRKKKITFNQNLPAEHPYLGVDLEEVGGGQSVLEANSVISNLPVLPLPNFILTPGQTLPLNSLHPRHISMFRRIISNHKVFAVVTTRNRVGPNGHSRELAGVGTLAQVLAFKEEESHEVTSLKIRAVGRQRVELLETKHNLDGSLEAKGRVLPEITLASPLKGIEINNMARFKLKPLRKLPKTPVAGIPNKYNPWFAATFSPWSPILLKQYDMDLIVSEIVEELKQWFDPEKVEQMSECRVEFSYWVASNLPLDDDTKLQLLGVDCTLTRLQAELNLMKQYSSLCCARCGIKVGEKKDIFSMSVDGPMGAYVNPGGYVHEMITLLTTTQIETISRPSTENSWFPGYAWEILQCSRCQAHLGWRFTTRKRHLKPSKFWGLTRTSIVPKLNSNNVPSESEGENTESEL